MASIRKRNNRWQARITRQGHKPLAKTFSTRADAEAWARRAESELERGLWLDIASDAQLTLSEALKRYHQERGSALRGVKADQSRAAALCSQPVGSRPIASIRGSDLAKLRDDLGAEGYSPSSVRKFLGLISRVYSMARLEWDMPINNPVQAVRKPTEANARSRRLKPRELDRVLAATESPELGAIIILAIETAMRRGELVSLTWADIHLKRQTAHLERTKNGEARTVPLSLKAVGVLRGLPRRIDGKVFGIGPSSVTQAFDRACRRAGVENLRFHDLRHEAVSRLFEKGLNPMQVAAISGHKTLQMLKRYTHLNPEELAQRLG